jgi:hypothetical protein
VRTAVIYQIRFFAFLRTAVMYKERFVDGFKDGGVCDRIRLSFFFLRSSMVIYPIELS